MDTESCGSCRWSQPMVCDEHGDMFTECRRYPPMLIVIDDEATKAWPQVDSSDWCGEYESMEVRR